MTEEEHMEWFEERAAIIQFDAGLSREQADKAAYWEWRRMVGPKVKAPTAMQVKRESTELEPQDEH